MAAKQFTNPVWIVRDYPRCSGCRLCEIVCSLSHEGKIWPEASRIRIFALVPGVEIPHLCAQCHDYPCVEACPTKPKALSIDEKTGAVLVNRSLCTACRRCIEACPGNVPFLHPGDGKATICDLCGGDPQCVRECAKGRFFAIWMVQEQPSVSRKLFARRPEEITKDVATNLLGEQAEEVL